MIATHRVVDTEGNLVGYCSGGKMYSVDEIHKHINKFDNLRIITDPYTGEKHIGELNVRLTKIVDPH